MFEQDARQADQDHGRRIRPGTVRGGSAAGCCPFPDRGRTLTAAEEPGRRSRAPQGPHGTDPDGALYVRKSAGSAFTNPALGAALEAHRVRCALRRGLVEEVLREAVAWSSDRSRDRALGRLTEGGARVTAAGHGRARDRSE